LNENDRSYISPVSQSDLEAAWREGRFDSQTLALLKREFHYNRRWWLGPSPYKNRDSQLRFLKNRGWKPTGHTPPLKWESETEVILDEQIQGNFMGLALSGGGIRSATFSLGVMQALAEAKVLCKFDYLSTVSGGGYIGSSLTWWLHRTEEDIPTPLGKMGATRPSLKEKALRFITAVAKPFRRSSTSVGQPPAYVFDLAEKFPYGTDDPNPPLARGQPASTQAGQTGHLTAYQRDLLRFLRQHGNYLTPGAGLGIAAGIATALRAVFLSVLWWVLLPTVVFALVMHIPRAAQLIAEGFLDATLLRAFLKVISELLTTPPIGLCPGIDDFTECVHSELGDKSLFAFLQLTISAAIPFLIAAILTASGKPLLTRVLNAFAAPKKVVQRLSNVAGSGFVKSIVFLGAFASIPAVSGYLDRIGQTHGGFELFLSRSTAAAGQTRALAVFQLLIVSAVAVLVLALVAAIAYSVFTAARIVPGQEPYDVRRRVESGSGKAFKWFVGLLVIGSVPYTAFALREYVEVVGVGGVISGLGAGVWTWMKSRGGAERPVLPAGLVGMAGALLLLYGGALIAFWLAVKLLQGHWDYTLPALLGGTVAYGLAVQVNRVSLHRFYRDRLMEAFMPSPDSLSESAPPALVANKLSIQDAWPDQRPNSPFPIINTNLVLVDSADRRRRLRGGDNFVLTPLYCGSNATGWALARSFLGGSLKLATAMAISGAAANPNAGGGGKGITRNRAVSMLMTVLGAALGYWVRHPDYAKKGRFKRFLLPAILVTPYPNRIFPETLTVLGGEFCESGHFLQLSDGGHFENLGLYELVRRRLRLVLLCDGACDPRFAFADFQVAIRRIGEDFGARIDFTDDNHLEVVMPVPPDDSYGSASATYPPGTRFAGRGHVVGTITYCDGSKGILIYIKSTMIEGLSLKTKGYKGAHPAFPHETTADQFFDEDQFEAYRELGYRLGRIVADEVRVSVGGVTSVGLANVIADIEQGKVG
jgi:hypothetical protein